MYVTSLFAIVTQLFPKHITITMVIQAGLKLSCLPLASPCMHTLQISYVTFSGDKGEIQNLLPQNSTFFIGNTFDGG